MKKMLIIVTMVMIALVMVVGGFQIKEDIEEQKELECETQLIEGTDIDCVVVYYDRNGNTHSEAYNFTDM